MSLRNRCLWLLVCLLAMPVMADGFLLQSRFHKTLPPASATHAYFADIFTQGLLVDGDKMWASSGLYGKSFLVLMDWKNQKVIKKGQVADDFFAEGITLLNDKLYMLTWKKGVAYQLDPYTFELLKVFNYEGQGWGLTHDGKRLIMSDGSDTLYYRNAETFAVEDRKRVRMVDKSVFAINEMEWVEGKIWANVFQTDYILVIDPATGLVESRYYAPELRPRKQSAPRAGVLNGIAYDATSRQLFLTGKNWSRLYQFDHEIFVTEKRKQ